MRSIERRICSWPVDLSVQRDVIENGVAGERNSIPEVCAKGADNDQTN